MQIAGHASKLACPPADDMQLVELIGGILVSDKKKGGAWGSLILILVIFTLIRFNLPTNEVSSALDLSELESKGAFAKVTGGMAAKVLVTDTVAGWQYRDFLVIKIAQSNRFDLIAVGLPFCKWKVYASEDE